MKHTLVPTHILKRMSDLWPADMSDDGSGRMGFLPKVIRHVKEFREFLNRPAPTADVLVVGELRYLDEDMGDGYYVKCVDGLTEEVVDGGAVMTVAQHQSIVARYTDLLTQASYHLKEHAMEYKHPGQLDLIAEINAFIPKEV